QGGGDGRGHRLRAGPGQGGGHLQGWEIDVGQVADRQRVVPQCPRQDDRDRQQGGHHRAEDERLADVHFAAPSPAGTVSAGFASTLPPGATRSCPSTTTTSPPFSPLAITASS